VVPRVPFAFRWVGWFVWLVVAFSPSDLRILLRLLTFALFSNLFVDLLLAGLVVPLGGDVIDVKPKTSAGVRKGSSYVIRPKEKKVGVCVCVVSQRVI
jgi:hypothetical protein